MDTIDTNQEIMIHSQEFLKESQNEEDSMKFSIALLFLVLSLIVLLVLVLGFEFLSNRNKKANEALK